MESDRQPSAVDDIHDDDFVPGEQNNPLIPNANEDAPELLEASDEHDMDDNNRADEEGEDSSNNPSNDTEVEIQLQQSGGTSGPPRKAVTVLFTGRNMSAVALLMGTSCLTVRQYVDVRKFINYEIDGEALMPSYPTVLYTLYPALYDVCFTRHIFIHEEVNVLAADVTAMVREQADSGETLKETVLITLPSAWTLRDVSKMRELINTTMQMYQRPRISNYFETQMGKQGRLMNESSLLSEYKIVNSPYEYGRFVYEGDMIQVTFTTTNSTFKANLLRNGLLFEEGIRLALRAVVCASTMRQGDTIADGVGDLLLSLKIIGEGRLDASPVYLLAGIAPGWSSLLQLSCDGFDSELARVLSISLQSRNDETIGPAPPMGELADGRPYI